MRDFRLLSAAEQLAARLREEILRGNLSGAAPGVHRLAAEYGVHRTTAEEALRLLGNEGLLMPQGTGRRRLIAMPENFRPPALRLRILHYEESDRTLNYILDLQHRLMEAGHSVGFAPRSLIDVGRDVKRVARMVKETEADAWLVMSGTKEVIEWFAAQPLSAFALFGQWGDARIAGTGPDKLPAMRAVVRRLIALGHRKVVMLLRTEHRKPQLGSYARAFLDEMESHGLSTSGYNLPDWEDSGDDFRRCIDSLFQVTPPSALLLDEAFLLNLAQHHLARRGILAPEQVSLVCADPDPAFGWSYPTIAHIRWEPRQVVRRIVQWADNVARGIDDRQQTFAKAEFVEGGTIGPVKP